MHQRHQGTSGPRAAAAADDRQEARENTRGGRDEEKEAYSDIQRAQDRRVANDDSLRHTDKWWAISSGLTTN